MLFAPFSLSWEHKARRKQTRVFAAEALQQAASARVKSSMRSSVASSPTENRIKPSAIPARARSSGVIPECDVVDGRVIRL